MSGSCVVIEFLGDFGWVEIELKCGYKYFYCFDWYVFVSVYISFSYLFCDVFLCVGYGFCVYLVRYIYFILSVFIVKLLERIFVNRVFFNCCCFIVYWLVRFMIVIYWYC